MPAASNSSFFQLPRFTAEDLEEALGVFRTDELAHFLPVPDVPPPLFQGDFGGDDESSLGPVLPLP